MVLDYVPFHNNTYNLWPAQSLPFTRPQRHSLPLRSALVSHHGFALHIYEHKRCLPSMEHGLVSRMFGSVWRSSCIHFGGSVVLLQNYSKTIQTLPYSCRLDLQTSGIDPSNVQLGLKQNKNCSTIPLHCPVLVP